MLMEPLMVFWTVINCSLRTFPLRPHFLDVGLAVQDWDHNKYWVVLVPWSVGTKSWLVGILPLKTDHSGVVLITGDFGDPSDQYGLFTQ